MAYETAKNTLIKECSMIKRKAVFVQMFIDLVYIPNLFDHLSFVTMKA